jgi:hypothetical protein
MADNTDNGAGNNGGNQPADKPWYDGADAGLVAHLQQHGWDKKTVNEVALTAAQSHLAAQKLIGVPPDQLLRVPKDAADADGWAKLYDKLGVPKEYALGELKFQDGTAVDKEMSDFFVATAKSLHLTETAAKQLAGAVIGQMDKASAAEKAAETVQREANLAELKKNWGANWDANLFVAQRAAAQLGITKDQLDAVEKTAGYAHVMDMFRNIASKLGEDKVIMGGDQKNVPMTRDMAESQRQVLLSDPAWRQRYLAGGKAELNEMMALNTIILGKAA